MKVKRPLTFGMGLSLGIHLAAAGALAAWSSYRITESVELAGHDRVIELTSSIITAALELEPITVDQSVNSSVPVVIKPRVASLDRRTFTITTERPPRTSDLTIPPVGPEEHDPIEDQRTVPPEIAMPEREQVVERTERRATRQFEPIIALTAELPTDWGTNDKLPPDLSHNPPPNYPAEAVKQGLEGTVLLRVEIDDSGTIVDVRVARSSGHPILDGAAIAAVRRWKGKPAYRGGEAIATVEILPIQFRLQ